MSFVAEAELTIDAPAAAVFDRLVDFAGWPRWMPASFAPVLQVDAPPSLRLGDRFRVRIGGSPFASTLQVSILVPSRELGWRGGVRGLLCAEHRFVLVPQDGRRTRVRSVETWRGALSAVTRGIVRPLAERIGREQLAGLTRAAVSSN